MKRRRALQYSLRTLIGTMVVTAVWLAIVSHRARRQQNAIAAIEAVGGTVLYDCFEPISLSPTPAVFRAPGWVRKTKDYFQWVEGASLANCQSVEPALGELESLDRLKVLDLEGTPIDDQCLRTMSPLRSLEYLVICRTKLTHAGFVELARVAPNVQQMWISSPDDGVIDLARLSGFTKLQSLHLYSIRGPGLQNLKHVRSLRGLTLRSTDLSDDDLVHLQGLDQLTNVYLRHSSNYSVDAVRILQDHLPTCDVDHRYKSVLPRRKSAVLPP